MEGTGRTTSEVISTTITNADTLPKDRKKKKKYVCAKCRGEIKLADKYCTHCGSEFK